MVSLGQFMNYPYSGNIMGSMYRILMFCRDARLRRELSRTILRLYVRFDWLNPGNT